MADLLHSQYFSIDEFKGREKEVRSASGELFKRLDLLRETLGEPIFPSPVAGALARFDGSKTSRHYAVERLSDAIDIFFGGASFLRLYNSAIRCGFGGIGIYPYTKFRGQDWPMMHLDLRPNKIPLVWGRDGMDNYIYPYQRTDMNWVLLFEKCIDFQHKIQLTDRE